MTTKTTKLAKDKTKKKNWWQTLGPGLITGASDNDPSGIATYSQAGAQFGFGLLWTMLFSYPLMSSIQDISAEIGRVTGYGIAGNLRRYYPQWLTYGITGLMVIANTINLGADIGAMGSALKLLNGGSALFYASMFAIISLVLEITIPYHKYASILKWLTLVLFAYVATVLVIHVPWGDALRATVIPSLSLQSDYLTTLVAILGTTISPYLFFWQASQEVEETEITPSEQPLKKAPKQAPEQLKRIRFDTYTGMGFSNIIAFFIILTAAVTLHTQGKTDIQTASEAAEALRPIAGNFAFFLFSVGIIGTGLLAVPVLAGSAAYGLGEALKWPTGLERKPLEAKGFYVILAISTLIGLGMNFFTSIDPVKALFWSAVINGVVAPPVMLVMMLMSTNPKVMGKFTISKYLKIGGWLATSVMFVAAAGLFLTWKS
ncbi:divalent metal cation transporter (plasmid) [Pseudanabaena biceps]|nr:divalent metal cation transporter [Pseudanabaena biceps]NUN67262.1 divalent metal cation transporter [Pseudanabaena biceps]NUN67393.1 divalent metal cation transporter [Pseudanabaena biceps]